MGKAEQAFWKKYPTVFARVLAELSGYLGDDMEQLAKDQVSEVEPPYGDEEREALHARLESHDAQPPSAAFMHALARNLDLDGRDQTKLAMALAFEN